jgi:hypothetical protein
LDNAVYVAMILSILILLTSMISVELGVTVAIVEIVLAVVWPRKRDRPRAWTSEKPLLGTSMKIRLPLGGA